MARSVCCSPSTAKLSPPLKTWPSFDAEGVGTAFSRLVEAFVLMNGRRGQIGDVNGQAGTRVIRWHRGHRAAWEDRLLAAGTRPDCLSGQMFRWCECEGGSDGPGELSYALWGHGGRARRPPDGPDGLGARGAKSPVRVRGFNPFPSHVTET